MIQNKTYEHNTIGYHRQYAERVFGEGSAPVIWLDEQAEKSNKGYDEKASGPEEKILAKLRALHEEEEADGKDAADDLEDLDFNQDVE